MIPNPWRGSPAASGGEGGRLPLAAFAVVILALVALAVIPAAILQRISRVSEEVATFIIPAYNGMQDVALAMERRASAARGRFIAGDSAHDAQLAEARAAEAAALRTLDDLAPRLGSAAEAHLAAVQRYGARRDSLESAVVAAPLEMDAYRASLPEFERLRDSMLVHLAALERELVRATDARLAEEARWVGLQQGFSFVLGVLALLAALVVGWFARLQRRLRMAVQRALAEADRRREELERVTESRARLMRGFSHDVKNPLGAAHGYLQLLEDGIMGPLTPEQLHGVRRSAASIGSALTLVDDLLEIARAESGTLELDPQPTDLRAVAYEAAEEYRAQAARKGLALRLELPRDLPPVVTDERRVRQVLGNLLSNAVKYTPQGEVAVRLAGADGAGPLGRPSVAIEVADTGPGIAPEQQPLLFQEFVRLDPAAGGGAGVGLTISQRLAHALRGEITVESRVGRGSTFTLWIPAHLD